MLYFQIKEDRVVDITHDHTIGGGDGWISRCDMETFDYASAIAVQANQLSQATDAKNRPSGPRRYVACDNGPHVYPRYDVVRAPQVHDPVSHSFNGDTRPDGRVVKVSTSLRRVETDTGSVYYRRKLTGTWIKARGTWVLVRGHINERNRSF